MLRSDLITYLSDYLQDDNASVTMAELERVSVLGVIDYSRAYPEIVNLSLTTTAGILSYSFPENCTRIYNAISADLLSLDYIIVGRTIIFTADPGTGTVTLTAGRIHLDIGSGSYPTIPADHLDYVGDLAYARILERLADEIAKRPQIGEGQTDENWQTSADRLYRRAAVLRARVMSELDDSMPVVG